jgi:hypothetical protein
MSKKLLLTMTLSAMLMIGVGGPARSSSCSPGQKTQCSKCSPTSIGGYSFLYNCCDKGFKKCEKWNWQRYYVIPTVIFTSLSDCKKTNASFCDEYVDVQCHYDQYQRWICNKK